MTTYVLDANVIIDGVFAPDGPSANLPASRFVTSRQIQAEVLEKIRERSPDTQVAAIAVALVERYLQEQQVAVVDVDLPVDLAAVHDGHVVACARAHQGTVVTRNTADLEGLTDCITPVGLLRKTSHQSWSLEMPPRAYSQTGTFAMGIQAWPGESFGAIVMTEQGARIGFDSQGRLANGPHQLTRTKGRLPHGQWICLVARWSNHELRLDYCPTGDGAASTLRTLAHGPIDGPLRVVALQEAGWSAEVAWTGFDAQWLGDQPLRSRIRLESFLRRDERRDRPEPRSEAHGNHRSPAGVEWDCYRDVAGRPPNHLLSQ